MTVHRSIDYWSFFVVPLAVKSAVANGKTDRARETRSIFHSAPRVDAFSVYMNDIGHFSATNSL